jgi:hypothetical protein
MSRRLSGAVRVRKYARGGFYRPERAGKEVAEGGGPGGVRGFYGRCGCFGRVLACMAASCGVVTSVQACWRGQRRGREMGGPGCFVSTFLLGLMAGVRAGRWGVDREESRRDLGHCGKDMGTSEVALYCLQT